MPDVTVSGDHNFVIVAGGDVYLPAAPATPPTGDDRRNLANLLGHVRRIWITGVLDRSVSHAELLDPRARMEPGAVEPPWRRYLEAAGQPPGIVPPDVSIGRVFGEVGRMLLILGEPGAGKSTTLLTLARECIEEAERDPSAPVPVVLSLSSWTGSRPFRDWLVGELSSGYGVGKAFARRWLEDHRLLLLLDGLDEVGEDRRAGCVEALHAFVEEHGAPGLGVCCRSGEYTSLPVRLKLGGAVVLLPLEPAQVDAYLDAAGPALDGLRGALARSAELRELSESPLMLSIMTLAFRGLPADALRFDEKSTREELREEIFGRFVDRMFALRGRPDDGFSRGRVEDGLRWLASGMRERGSIFAIELLQPAWLTARQMFVYTVLSRVAGTAVLGFSAGMMGLVLIDLLAAPTSGNGAQRGGLTFLVVCVTAGFMAGLLCVPLEQARFRASLRQRPLNVMINQGVRLQLVLMAIAGAVYVTCMVVASAGIHWWSDQGYPLGLMAESAIVPYFTYAFMGRLGRGDVTRDISLAGPPTWRGRAALRGSLHGTVITGIPAVALAFVSVLPPVASLALASTGLILGFGSGGWAAQAAPGQQNQKFLLRFTVLVTGLGWFLTVALQLLVVRASFSSIQPISYVVAAAVLIPALYWYNCADLMLHAVLREILVRAGAIPRRLGCFLEYATHLGFLQHVGGGYTFFHRLLLEHFATRPPPIPCPTSRSAVTTTS